jgi:hypothetical protein
VAVIDPDKAAAPSADDSSIGSPVSKSSSRNA